MVPVIIIAGYLGSGKTTLVNRLFSNVPSGKRIAIIVNDFGKVPVDAVLIERPGYSVYELTGGCICCSLRVETAKALAEIVARENPDIIIMEATGLAEPGEIARDIEHMPDAIGMFSRPRVIVVVDAKAFHLYAAKIPAMTRMLPSADVVVVNKIDLLSAEEVDAVALSITAQAKQHVVVIRTLQGNVPPDIIFGDSAMTLAADAHRDAAGESAFAPSGGHGEHGHHHDSTEGMQSDVFETGAVISYDKLTRYFTGNAHRFVRAKGFVITDRGPKLLQATLSGVAVTDHTPVEKTRIVCIFREGERGDIAAELSALIVP